MSNPEDVRRVAISHHHQLTGKFEDHYADFDRDRFTSAFTYGRSKIDRILDELFDRLPGGASILDVGCGTGEQLRRAQERGLVATGVEPAPAMLAAARKNVPTARIVDGLATSLPFGDRSFDAVIEIEVLRYLHRSDIGEALAEARRVLRPGGFVLVTLVNRWALDGFYLKQRARQIWSGRKFSDRHPHCEFFSPAEAARALHSAGFVDVEVHGRLLAPLRVLYKLAPGVGRRLARAAERADDAFHRRSWTRAFAGHLVAIGRAAAD